MAERHTFVIDRHADGSLTLVDHVGPAVRPSLAAVADTLPGMWCEACGVRHSRDYHSRVKRARGKAVSLF